MKKLVFSLALLLGLFMFAGCGNQTPTDDVEEGTTVTMEGDEISQEEFESTFIKMYKKWSKVTCAITMNQEWVEMKGMMYLDGKKMRYDFNGAAGGMNYSMSTVTKDGYSYVRSSMSKEGMKIAFNEDEMESDSGAADESGMSTPVKFNCTKGVDKSDAFELPSNITFQEMAY